MDNYGGALTFVILLFLVAGVIAGICDWWTRHKHPPSWPKGGHQHSSFWQGCKRVSDG